MLIDLTTRQISKFCPVTKANTPYYMPYYMPLLYVTSY